MTKLYTFENGKIIPVKTPGNIDTVAASLTNDPVYGTIVSSDQEQTANALSYVLMFAMLPFFVMAYSIFKNYGAIGLICVFVYAVIPYFFMNKWIYFGFMAASIFSYFKWAI